MIGDIFPFQISVCVRSFNVEDLLLSVVYYMVYPCTATAVLLTGYRLLPKAVSYLSWAIDELVEFGPGL